MSALHHIEQSSNCVPWSITLAPGGGYRLPELLVLRGTQKHPRLITVGELWPQPICSAKKNPENIPSKVGKVTAVFRLVLAAKPNFTRRTFHSHRRKSRWNAKWTTHTHTHAKKKHCTFRGGCTQDGRTDGGESKIMHHDTKQEQIRAIRTNRERRMFFDNWLAGWQFFALTLASVLLLLFAATANVARV